MGYIDEDYIIKNVRNLSRAKLVQVEILYIRSKDLTEKQQLVFTTVQEELERRHGV